MNNGDTRYLEPTRLLDWQAPAIQSLVAHRQWMAAAPFDRIGQIYDFVRNEIPFGYNEADDIPASRVLGDGYGQCNTKSTLLMALLRACEIPCRFHGFTIDKALQKGAIAGLAYRLAPRNIVHSWVEVLVNENWVHLEGVILDREYLESIQRHFPEVTGAFSGFAVATPCMRAPPVEWQGTHTYIQKDGINRDFGVFDSPDEFYAQHPANLRGTRRWLFRHVVRHRINRNIQNIREFG